ncbi:MAG: extracellular solute-binding protein [Treponema sp.]|nr:extracellular solute-binding protein [Treponema sp.]
MKKIIVFTSLVMILFATGFAFAAGGSQSNTGAKEVVVFMEQGDIRDDIQPALFKDFETSSGYKINVINGGTDAQYRQNLAVAMSGNQPIDVLICNGQAVRPFYSKGIIEDLTTKVNYWDRFISSSIELATFNGKIYGVPFGTVTTSGLYINNDVLKKYNLTPPKTYDDLLAMKNALSKDNISVFAFGGGSKYMWPMWYFCTFAQTSGNQALARTEAALTGKAKFTDKDYVDAMAVLERMGKDGFFQPGFNGTESDPAKAVFLSGNAAMFFGGTWEMQNFRDSGLTGDKMSMVGFPIVVPGAKSEQTGAAGSPMLCLFKGLDAQRQKVALQFMDYLSTDAKVQQNADLLGISQPSVNKGYKIPANADPIVINAIIPTLAPSTVTFLDWYWPAEVVTAFQDQIQAVTGGQTTSANAMAAIQKVFDDLVKNGYQFE